MNRRYGASLVLRRQLAQVGVRQPGSSQPWSKSALYLFRECDQYQCDPKGLWLFSFAHLRTTPLNLRLRSSRWRNNTREESVTSMVFCVMTSGAFDGSFDQELGDCSWPGDRAAFGPSMEPPRSLVIFRTMVAYPWISSRCKDGT